MPVVKAFKARIKITGQDPDAGYDEFFNFTKHVYGSTIGEMLDNLVAETVLAAEQVRKFNRLNKPKGYKMADDHWFFTWSGPRAFQLEGDEDSGAGSRVSDYASIVSTMGHYRHMAIEGAILDLNSAYRQMNLARIELTREEKDYKGYHFRKLEEVAKAGLSGAFLDTLLDAAHKVGADKRIVASTKERRRMNEITRQMRVKDREKTVRKEEKAQTKGVLDFLLGR